MLQAREDLQAGRISAARLRAIEDEAIRTVVKMQEQIAKLRLVVETAREVWG